MTYRELLNRLSQLSDEQLDKCVIVCDNNSQEDFLDIRGLYITTPECSNEEVGKDYPYFKI